MGGQPENDSSARLEEPMSIRKRVAAYAAMVALVAVTRINIGALTRTLVSTPPLRVRR